MPSQLFTIRKFYRSAKYVIVYVAGRTGAVNVPRDDFENWLERTDRLLTITEVTPGHDGEPEGGEEYTMDLRDYWTCQQEVIAQDLYEYILYNMNCDIIPAIKRITSDPSVVKQYRRAI